MDELKTTEETPLDAFLARQTHKNFSMIKNSIQSNPLANGNPQEMEKLFYRYIEEATRKVLKTNTRSERLAVESYLDGLYMAQNYFRKVLSEAGPTSDNLHFPDYSDSNFSRKLDSLPRFHQFKIPKVQKEDFSRIKSPEFVRSPAQNFVSSYISPDTPYNGILVWHGVGVGKTCAALSISEGFVPIMKSEGKRILVITPSEQLQETWKTQIYNFEMELTKRKYNDYLKAGGKLKFQDYISNLGNLPERESPDKEAVPINNIQCTGDRYSPFKEGSHLSNLKLKRLLKKKIQEMYEFTTYNKLANEYDRTEKSLYQKGRGRVEGTLVKWIKSKFTNRIIIGDEIHRVGEDEGTKSMTKKVVKTIGQKVLVKRDQSGKYHLGKITAISSDDKYTVVLDKSGKTISQIVAQNIKVNEQSAKQLKMTVLQLIARYAKNTKFVFLSATPMYSTAVEILDIINLLLLNDNQPPLIQREIFHKNGFDLQGEPGSPEREAIEQQLMQQTRGYISYLRGENPVSFPIRLDPNSQILVNDGWWPELDQQGYEPRPIYSFVSEDKTSIKRQILDCRKDWIRQLTLYRNTMSAYQFACWYLICKTGLSSQKGIKEWNYKGLLQNRPPTHASIIVFPTIQEEEAQQIIDRDTIDESIIERVSGCYGKKGFRNTFIGTTRANAPPYKYREGIDPEFLDLKQIQNPGKHNLKVAQSSGIYRYSSKIYNILRLINSCQGIVFIYSEYVADGVNLIGMALERNGYRHFVPGQVWDNEREDWQYPEGVEPNDLLSPELIATGQQKRNWQGKLWSELEPGDSRVQGRYILLKGEDMSDSLIDNLIKEARGEKGTLNQRGEHIKVIIGSKKVREGFSLKRVRQVHILDPWYHLKAIDQSSGRGMRNDSHQLLPAPERNVTVFLHSSSLPHIPSLGKKKTTLLYTVLQNILFNKDITQESWNIAKKVLKGEVRSSDAKYVNQQLQLLESSDEYIYRGAYEKGKAIGYLERKLQTNAIDCYLNKNGNMFPPSVFDRANINPYSLVSSQGKQISDFRVGFKNFSWQCGFQDCSYRCIREAETEAQPVRRDSWVNLSGIKDIELERAKDKFRRYFRLNYTARLDSILESFRSTDIPQEKIYQAITEVVRNREPVFDTYLRKGYVIYRSQKGDQKLNSLYIFQPIWDTTQPSSELLLNRQDEAIEMTERIVPVPYRRSESVVDSGNYEVRLPKSKQTINVLSADTDKSSSSNEAENLVQSLQKYIVILYSYIIDRLGKFYPPAYPSPRSLKHISVTLKGKDGCQNTCPIPTQANLLLMTGFSILDPLNREEELEILRYTCTKAALRIQAINSSNKPEELWVNLEDEAKVLKRPFKGLQVVPSLEMVCYYYFLGGLPEVVSEQDIARKSNTWSEGDKVTYIGLTDDRFNAVVQSTEPLRIKNLQTQQLKRVKPNELTTYIDPRRQIYFQNVVINKKTYLLPHLVRHIDKTGVQILFSVNYDSSLESQLTRLKGDLSSSNIQDVKLTLQDIDPGEDSLFIGYSNPESQTASCNCLGMSKFSDWDDKEAIHYILSCFYFQNRLRERTLGCCGRQQGKKDKVKIINTIISSTFGTPYEQRFNRYSDTKSKVLPSEVMDSNLSQKQLDVIHLKKNTDIKEPDVTLELLLLLRFFRFVQKGECLTSTKEYKWFLRKSEMYAAWSKNLGDSETLPSQGRSRKKK